MSEFEYKQSLERARKAVLDSRSKFAAPTAQDTKEATVEGLIRPRARPQDQEATQSTASGIGLALMEALTPAAPEESPRPQARPEGGDEGPRRPAARPGTVGVGSFSDKEILALTLQAEAGGEGYEGMLAAGSVIANRAASGKYGKGITGVIMKPGQFSAWNGVTGYAGGEGAINMDKVRPSKSALKAAEAILSGNYEDITGGATHYYNPKVASPAWGGDVGDNWFDIGRHRFGKA
jgi:spore germination cell wall hydrolase CwlJ-like protein